MQRRLQLERQSDQLRHVGQHHTLVHAICHRLEHLRCLLVHAHRRLEARVAHRGVGPALRQHALEVPTDLVQHAGVVGRARRQEGEREEKEGKERVVRQAVQLLAATRLQKRLQPRRQLLVLLAQRPHAGAEVGSGGLLVQTQHHVACEGVGLRLVAHDLAEGARHTQKHVHVAKEGAQLVGLTLHVRRRSECHGEEEELLEEEFHLLGDGGELPVVLLDAREHRVLERLVVRALRQVGDFVGDGDARLPLTRPTSPHRVVTVQRVVCVSEHP